MLAGGEGEGVRLAMRLVVRMAEATGAERLIDISGAHVNSCFYSGDVLVDYGERLLELGARVRVPTTLNIGWLDPDNPGSRGSHPWAAAATRLLEIYAELGGEPVFTCAPYHLPGRPKLGEHVAWAESNAVSFANSVLGARTDKYGDFSDVAAAITGRVPETGLHVTENRAGQVVVELDGLPPALLREETFFHVLGTLVGHEVQTAIPVLVGLPGETSEDYLRAFAGAAASSGGVSLFHAVGVTPEAPTLADAMQGREPRRVLRVNLEALREARDSLTTARNGAPLDSVHVGTPHLSVREFERLAGLIGDQRFDPGIEFYVSTSEFVVDEARRKGVLEVFERAGGTVVVSTCTYWPGILDGREGLMLTSSAKWAYYAPPMLDVKVAFGTMKECVRSAVEGRLWRDDEYWGSGLWG
jgi:predicted aconitase